MILSSYVISGIGYKPQHVMAQKQQITVIKREPNETWLTYRNSTLGVKIQYPSDWIKVEGRNNNNLVKFFPPEIRSGSIHAFIQVRVVNIPTSMQDKISLEQYTQKELNQLRKSFNITDSHASTIAANHNPAHTILYGAEDFKGMKTWTIKDSRIYLITYAAKTEKYPIYLPTIQGMINSFNIIK
jgi:eukaryotic-like serine/threonine-protein kinase